MRAEVVAVGTELLLGQIVDTNSVVDRRAAGPGRHRLPPPGSRWATTSTASSPPLRGAPGALRRGRSSAAGSARPRTTSPGTPSPRSWACRWCATSAIEAAHPRHVRRPGPGHAGQQPAPGRRARRGDDRSPSSRAPRPGLVCPIGDKVVYAVPGVPSEMKEMVAGTVIPDLRRRSGDTSVILSPGAADVGPVGVRRRRAAGRPDRRPRRRRQPDDRLPGLGHRGHQGPHHGQGRRRRGRRRAPRRRGGGRSGPCSATSSSASTTRPWRRPCSACSAGAGLTVGLVESVTGGLMASRLAAVARRLRRCSGAAWWLDGPARAARCSACPTGAGASARRRPGPWPVPVGARSAPTSAWPSPASAGPTEEGGHPVGHRVRRAWRSASAATRSTLRLPGDRERIRELRHDLGLRPPAPGPAAGGRLTATGAEPRRR